MGVQSVAKSEINLSQPAMAQSLPKALQIAHPMWGLLGGGGGGLVFLVWGLLVCLVFDKQEANFLVKAAASRLFGKSKRSVISSGLDRPVASKGASQLKTRRCHLFVEGKGGGPSEEGEGGGEDIFKKGKREMEWWKDRWNDGKIDGMIQKGKNQSTRKCKEDRKRKIVNKK